VRPWSRQYAAIIFYHNEEQKRLARESRDRLESMIQGDIHTEIVPFVDFYLAEGYHQKYRLRQVPELLREYQAIYPDEQDLINSTAVARVNGYVGGNGTQAKLEAELDGLGLSPTGQDRLMKFVEVWNR